LPRFQIVGKALLEAARSNRRSVIAVIFDSAADHGHSTHVAFGFFPERSEASLNVRIEPLAQLAGGFHCVAACRACPQWSPRGADCAPSLSTKRQSENVSRWTHLSWASFQPSRRYEASESSGRAMQRRLRFFTLYGRAKAAGGYERHAMLRVSALFGARQGTAPKASICGLIQRPLVLARDRDIAD